MPENKLTRPIGIPLPGVPWRGLTLRFFLWIILPLILLLLAGTVGSMLLHQREMLEMVGMLDARTTRTAAALLSEELSLRADAISRVSAFLDEKVVDSEVLLDISRLVPCLDEGIAVVSNNGEVLAVTEGFLAEAGSFPAVQQLVDELEQEPPGVVFSPVFPHPVSGDSIFLVASPAGSAVLIGAVNLTDLMEQWVDAIGSSNPHVTIWLIDRSGDVLFRSQQGDPDPDAMLKALAGMQAEGSSFSVTRNGSGDHIVAYDEVDLPGWIVMIDEPWSAVASTALGTTLITPMALAPVLLLAVAALLYGARKIIQPLQALEMHARDLAWGNFQSIQYPVGGIEEIVHLQNTLIFLAEKVQTAQEGLRSYIGAITTGQEEERRRLARELHDETIQSLIALNQRAQLAQINAADSRTAKQLEDLETMIQQTIQDLRRVTHALRPMYLDDLGLVAALSMLGREITESDSLDVSFKQLGSEIRLPPETELAFFRIAQEALSNSIRHARAHSAALSIVYSPDTVVLIVSDDGIGFDVPESPAAFAPGGHFGLLGMYERAELIRAQLDIQSQTGGGTRLTVSVSRDYDPG